MSEAEEKNNNQAGEEEFIPTVSFTDSVDGPGGKIGSYKLLGTLGEGGFGIVYLAERQRPVKRRVALKVIKPGMDSKQVIARFETERQALALLDHPNIAQVFDAGTTKAGRPYFVMEYVKGVPLNEHSDREKLSIEERLSLFMQVCEGVQHAHQKGIIHRDIKPSNILVAIEGDRLVPKIIDFGVAKALTQPLTERTLYTEQGQLIGTPEYMSPEQAEMTAQDIDTRSDIYSLGVMLYELLTGALPFDRKTLERAGFSEIQRIIREEEPPRPSTKLTSLGEDAEKVAKRRHTEVATLARQLHKELEWIPLMAMRKERTHRYRTAADLADDIQNYLNGVPLTAGPESAVYRIKKFVWRNRAWVAGIAAVLVVLVAGIVASTLFAIGQARARAQAEQAREKEAAAHAEAQAVADFLKDDVLASVDPAKAKAPEVTVDYILDAASEDIEGKFEGKPLVEASVRQTLGNTYLSLGKYEAAEPHLERAVEIRREQLGEEHPDTAASMYKLGTLHFKQGRRDDAEPLYVKALDIRRRVLGAEHPDTLTSMYYLAWLFWETGRNNEAEPLLVKTLEAQRRVLGAEHPDTLVSMFGLAYVYQEQGRYDEAEPLFAKAVEGQRLVLGEEHPDTLRSVGGLGELYSEQGRYDEAEPLLVETVEINRRVLGEEHPRTLECMTDLGQLYHAQDRYDKAEPLYVKAMEVNRRVLGEDHPETLLCMNRLAWLYQGQGRYEEAEALYVKVLEVNRRVKGQEHPDTLGSMNNLAWLYQQQGRYDKAEELYVKALEFNRRVLGEEHIDTLGSMNNLAWFYYVQSRYDEAEPLFVKVLEVQRRVLGGEHEETLGSMNSLGLVYYEQGRYEEAEVLYVKLLEIRRRVLGEEHINTLQSMYWLAMIYYNQERHEEAEPVYVKLLEIARRVLGEESWGVLSTMRNLGQVYSNQGRYEEAESLLVEALEGLPSVVGEAHNETLGTMADLANLYLNEGRYGEAEPLFIEVLEVRHRVLGEQHPDTLAVRKKLVEVYEALGKPLLFEFELRASTPQPADGAVVDVASTRELNWLSGKEASQHKVYFGIDSNDLTFLAEVTSPNYDKLPALEKNTVYYWRIDAVQADGSVASGNVWSFTTGRMLVGWWKFDETKGRNVTDSSGMNRDGTLVGDPRWQPGRAGGALLFNGDSDYVSIGNESAFDISGSITVMAWIKVKAFDKAWQAIVTKGDSAWRLQRAAYQDTIEFACSGLSADGDPWVYGNTNVNDGQWHHVAGVYDGANISLYVDGELDASVSASGSINTNNEPVYIGEKTEWPGRHWDGLIDDVRLYNYALSETEIAAICAGEGPGSVDKLSGEEGKEE